MEQSEFSSFVLDIYKASAVPMHWQAVLEKLAQYVQNGKAIITRRNNIDGNIDIKTILGSKIYGITEKVLKDYIDCMAPHDIWTQYEWKYDVGELCVFSEKLSVDKLKLTKYYKEWLAPQGVSDGIAIQLYKNDVFRMVLNVLYDHKAENIKQLHEDLISLTPHLCQSMELWIASLGNDDSCYAVVNSNYLKKRYKLTRREAEIANLTARLGSYDEIADSLGLSTATIKTHMRTIKEKMKVTDRHGVMLIATGFIGYNKKM